MPLPPRCIDISLLIYVFSIFAFTPAAAAASSPRHADTPPPVPFRLIVLIYFRHAAVSASQIAFSPRAASPPPVSSALPSY